MVFSLRSSQCWCLCEDFLMRIHWLHAPMNCNILSRNYSRMQMNWKSNRKQEFSTYVRTKTSKCYVKWINRNENLVFIFATSYITSSHNNVEDFFVWVRVSIDNWSIHQSSVDQLVGQSGWLTDWVVNWSVNHLLSCLLP